MTFNYISCILLLTLSSTCLVKAAVPLDFGSESEKSFERCKVVKYIQIKDDFMKSVDNVTENTLDEIKNNYDEYLNLCADKSASDVLNLTYVKELSNECTKGIDYHLNYIHGKEKLAELINELRVEMSGPMYDIEECNQILENSIGLSQQIDLQLVNRTETCFENAVEKLGEKVYEVCEKDYVPLRVRYAKGFLSIAQDVEELKNNASVRLVEVLGEIKDNSSEFYSEKFNSSLYELERQGRSNSQLMDCVENVIKPNAEKINYQFFNYNIDRCAYKFIRLMQNSDYFVNNARSFIDNIFDKIIEKCTDAPESVIGVECTVGGVVGGDTAYGDYYRQSIYEDLMTCKENLENFDDDIENFLQDNTCMEDFDSASNQEGLIEYCQRIRNAL